MCSVKKMFLEILQNSQENPSAITGTTRDASKKKLHQKRGFETT